MSTSDFIPTKDGIVEALRQLTGQTPPPGHMMAGMGIFAAGLLAGAGLAVLFAPKVGAELRQEIGARVGGLRAKIAGAAEGTDDASEFS